MTGTIGQRANYTPRVVDTEIRELLRDLPALSLEGSKGVGKTESARRLRAQEFCLDDPAIREIISAQPSLLTTARTPTLIDEWQRYPDSWDVVRRAVDMNPSPGRFILTYSASPTARPAHSGAGRITPIRMRPLTLVERGLGSPTVSLGTLLAGERPDLSGTTDVVLSDYTQEILVGGFPGMRHSGQRAQRAALDGYIEAIINVDLPEIGTAVRNPDGLRRWLRAYAAATSTVTAFDKIRAAAVGAFEPAPAKTTLIPYRDALQRIWVLDPVPAWEPTHNHLKKLIGAPKHHLADPALAARLVGLDFNALLRGEGPASSPYDGTFLGQLFESLATLDLRVYAQAHEARTFHMRTQQGLREIDIILERGDQRVLAVEIKLSETVSDGDVKHLLWLKEKMGDQMLDCLVVTTGTTAYRRRDGVGVVPLALLGP